MAPVGLEFEASVFGTSVENGKLELLLVRYSVGSLETKVVVEMTVSVLMVNETRVLGCCGIILLWVVLGDVDGNVLRGKDIKKGYRCNLEILTMVKSY